MPSIVEIIFQPTPDGLVVDQVRLKPARAVDEPDLHRFLDRLRLDRDVDVREEAS